MQPQANLKYQKPDLDVLIIVVSRVDDRVYSRSHFESEIDQLFPAMAIPVS